MFIHLNIDEGMMTHEKAMIKVKIYIVSCSKHPTCRGEVSGFERTNYPLLHSSSVACPELVEKSNMLEVQSGRQVRKGKTMVS